MHMNEKKNYYERKKVKHNTNVSQMDQYPGYGLVE